MAQKEEGLEEQPDLMTLRVEYTALSHQLAQLDASKQAGQWARLYKQVQSAEERLRRAEQEPPPSQTSPPEFAKQKATSASRGEAAQPPAKTTETDERQAQLHAIASNLLYWKGGLKVFRQAQLPKWRGSFQGQRSRRCRQSTPGCAQRRPNRMDERRSRQSTPSNMQRPPMEEDKAKHEVGPSGVMKPTGLLIMPLSELCSHDGMLGAQRIPVH
jgi:hypothetical protein